MRASQVTQKWRILPASAGAAGEEVQCSGGEIPWRRKWQPTPVFFDSVFLPGKSHGLRSLVGYSPWSRKELDTAEHEHMVSVCDIDFCTQYQKSSMITTGSLAPISHCTTDPLCPFCPSLSLFNSCSNLVRRGYDCPFTGKETEVGEIKQQSKGQAALSGRARMPAIVTGPGHSAHFLLWFRSTWRSRAGSSSPSPSFLAPAHIFCKLTETKCPTSSSSSPQLEADLLNSCTRFGRLPGMFPSGQKKRIQWDKTEILGICTLLGSPSIALRASGYSGSPVRLGERGEVGVRELDQGYSNHHCLPLLWASTLKCSYSLPASLGQEHELGRSGKQGIGVIGINFLCPLSLVWIWV